MCRRETVWRYEDEKPLYQIWISCDVEDGGINKTRFERNMWLCEEHAREYGFIW